MSASSPTGPPRAGEGWALTGVAAGNLADHVGDDLEVVLGRREQVLSSLPAGVDQLVLARQVHGVGVHEVTEADLALLGGRPRSLPLEADALVTRLVGVALGVVVADCVPVLLLDPASGVVAAAHAGRAGADRGVVPAAVAAARALGADALRAVVGPAVCGRCYEVPEEMRRDVGSRHPQMTATTSWGTPSLDVGAGVLHQLDRLGVPAQVRGGCTLEDPTWFSVRRDGAGCGRGAALVWSSPPSASGTPSAEPAPTPR